MVSARRGHNHMQLSASASGSEQDLLLASDDAASAYGGVDDVSRANYNGGKEEEGRVTLGKHIGLVHTVGMIIGGVAGSGIFVSPTGVTVEVQSVGLSLIIWTLAGVFNLLLALCYAELGTALPVTGGDYAYLYLLLGPLPAFLCQWVMFMLVSPCFTLLMAETAATYIFSMMQLECNSDLTILLTVFIMLCTAVLNCMSVQWSSRLITAFSVAKVLALAVITTTGIVHIVFGEGWKNLSDPFEGSRWDASHLVLGFLPGFISYIGWDTVNNMAGEMRNPKRDLPLSMVLSMLLVTTTYVLTNLAYFSTLTIQEFLASDTVAVSFAAKLLGPLAWAVPIFVAISALGSSIGTFLAYPRYTFAGAQHHQLPRVLGLVSIHSITPTVAILAQCGLAVLLSTIKSLDLQSLLKMTSVIMQVRIMLTLVALLRLKRTQPNKHSTITVPVVVVVVCIILLTAIVVASVYFEPLLNGAACALFLSGVPVYFLSSYCKLGHRMIQLSDWLTTKTQQLLLLVPGWDT